MKKIFVLTLFLAILQLNGQSQNFGVDFRTGSGLTLLGSGDMMTLNLENELNFHVGSRLTFSPSFTMGRSTSGVYEHTSFRQINLNAFFSPFKSTGFWDFRFGGGPSYYHVADVWISSWKTTNGEVSAVEYRIDKRRSLGWSIIVENTFKISDRFLVGAKLFTQPFHNGDINSGLILKFGFVI